MKGIRAITFDACPNEVVLLPLSEIKTLESGGKVHIWSMEKMVTAMMHRDLKPMKILREFDTKPYPTFVHMN